MKNSWTDGNVLKKFKSKYGKIIGYPEMLGLCGAEEEFFLLVCDGYEEQVWKVFSSATDTWTETNWPTIRTPHFLMLRHIVVIIILKNETF